MSEPARAPAGDPAPGGAAPTRREQREARREQILLAATRLFGEAGFRGTSLRDLARACGVSHPTLLHYFPTKDDLLLAVLRRRDELTVEEIGRLSGPRELPAFLLRMSEVNASIPGIIALFTVTSAEATAPEHPAHPYYRERYRAAVAGLTTLLEQARHEGVLRPHVDPARAARSVFAVLDGAQVQWLLDPAGTDITGLLADQLRSIFVEDVWPPLPRRVASSVRNEDGQPSLGA